MRKQRKQKTGKNENRRQTKKETEGERESKRQIKKNRGEKRRKTGRGKVEDRKERNRKEQDLKRLKYRKYMFMFIHLWFQFRFPRHICIGKISSRDPSEGSPVQREEEERTQAIANRFSFHTNAISQKY